MVQIDLVGSVGGRPDPLNRCSSELLTTIVSTTPSAAVVVAVSGEVDMTNCAALRDEITAQLRFTRHLVVDLAAVTFLCAAGLTVLVVVSEAARRAGTKLCVVARTRQVRLPLMVTGLSGVLDLHLEVGEALACGTAGPPVSPAPAKDSPHPPQPRRHRDDRSPTRCAAEGQ